MDYKLEIIKFKTVKRFNYYNLFYLYKDYTARMSGSAQQDSQNVKTITAAEFGAKFRTKREVY